LALACKEVAAMLPVAVLLYDLVFLPADDPARRRRLRRVYSPLFAALAAAACLRLALYRSHEAPERDLDLAANLLPHAALPSPSPSRGICPRSAVSSGATCGSSCCRSASRWCTRSPTCPRSRACARRGGPSRASASPG